MTSPPVSSPAHHAKGRLTGIQIGRGIAALAVVATHAVAHPLPGVFEQAHFFGRYGVTLFFVISGYIMVVSTGQDSFNPVKFMLARIRRVVPLYWIATIVAALLALVLPAVFRTTEFDLSYIIKSMLFIPEYSPGDGTIRPFFKLGWTLNFEMFFYVCFAALYFLSDVRRAICLSFLYGALIAIGYSFDFQNPALSFYTNIDTLGFVAGVWLAIWAKRSTTQRPGVSLWLLLASVAIMMAIVIPYGLIREAPLTQVVLVIGCAMQVAALSRMERISGIVPRLLEIAGNASYSIYLFHMFGVGLGTVILLKLAPSMLVPAIVFAAISGTAIGLLVHYWVEAPLESRLRRLTRAQSKEPPLKVDEAAKPSA